ncbi:hypothetical protein PIB30_033267 [Stylosanthes scabra]|uniref:Uncharacterized protein n=1 Tax=Stylosanthes scabra TaxID=79078 RepID=A0ABU6ZCL0_9FABA|nr:hypothetical protein [Stylosanthes scabra]
MELLEKLSEVGATWLLSPLAGIWAELRRRSGQGAPGGPPKRRLRRSTAFGIKMELLSLVYRAAKLWALGLVQNSAPNLQSRLVGFASFLNKTLAQNAPSPLEGGFRFQASLFGLC